MVAGERAAVRPHDRHAYLETLKRRSENALTDPGFDFIATYHAVADLRHLAQKEPGVLDGQTIQAVARLLQSGAYDNLRQSYFLFREAASVMTDLTVAAGRNGLGAQALASLAGLLRHTHGNAHRGVAEALGSLPVGVAGPKWAVDRRSSPPALAWSSLLSAGGLDAMGKPWFVGRSLVTHTSRDNRLLVVKLARKDDSASVLAREIGWMERLNGSAWAVDRRFHIPAPLVVDHQRVFRVKGLPLSPPHDFEGHPDALAIAFVAHRDYFVYPNQQDISGATAVEMLGRNAYLMGTLAARGVIHDAPIPLFHNRTQRSRRDDQGRYQWYRSGRLDQWLDSCAFPNLGLSGLRDFEHLDALTCGGRSLYRHIGSHFLSLLLVAGSHFRARDSRRVGLDADGNPVDARDLFDRRLLKQMVGEIFSNYYTGFVGTEPIMALPVDLDRLTGRMVEEMGVDRHMTELLRRADQKAMNAKEFRTFLKKRGYRDEQVEGMNRGEKDILMVSGPHLGDFNRQISLPELIECVASMSAVCMAGRFLTTAAQSPARGSGPCSQGLPGTVDIFDIA